MEGVVDNLKEEVAFNLEKLDEWRQKEPNNILNFPGKLIITVEPNYNSAVCKPGATRLEFRGQCRNMAACLCFKDFLKASQGMDDYCERTKGCNRLFFLPINDMFRESLALLFRMPTCVFAAGMVDLSFIDNRGNADDDFRGVIGDMRLNRIRVGVPNPIHRDQRSSNQEFKLFNDKCMSQEVIVSPDVAERRQQAMKKWGCSDGAAGPSYKGYGAESYNQSMIRPCGDDGKIEARTSTSTPKKDSYIFEGEPWNLSKSKDKSFDRSGSKNRSILKPHDGSNGNVPSLLLSAPEDAVPKDGDVVIIMDNNVEPAITFGKQPLNAPLRLALNSPNNAENLEKARLAQQMKANFDAKFRMLGKALYEEFEKDLAEAMADHSDMLSQSLHGERMQSILNQADAVVDKGNNIIVLHPNVDENVLDTGGRSFVRIVMDSNLATQVPYRGWTIPEMEQMMENKSLLENKIKRHVPLNTSEYGKKMHSGVNRYGYNITSEFEVSDYMPEDLDPIKYKLEKEIKSDYIFIDQILKKYSNYNFKVEKNDRRFIHSYKIDNWMKLLVFGKSINPTGSSFYSMDVILPRAGYFISKRDKNSTVENIDNLENLVDFQDDSRKIYFTKEHSCVRVKYYSVLCGFMLYHYNFLYENVPSCEIIWEKMIYFINVVNKNRDCAPVAKVYLELLVEADNNFMKNNPMTDKSEICEKQRKYYMLWKSEYCYQGMIQTMHGLYCNNLDWLRHLFCFSGVRPMIWLPCLTKNFEFYGLPPEFIFKWGVILGGFENGLPILNGNDKFGICLRWYQAYQIDKYLKGDKLFLETIAHFGAIPLMLRYTFNWRSSIIDHMLPQWQQCESRQQFAEDWLVHPNRHEDLKNPTSYFNIMSRRTLERILNSNIQEKFINGKLGVLYTPNCEMDLLGWDLLHNPCVENFLAHDGRYNIVTRGYFPSFNKFIVNCMNITKPYGGTFTSMCENLWKIYVETICFPFKDICYLNEMDISHALRDKDFSLNITEKDIEAFISYKSPQLDKVSSTSLINVFSGAEEIRRDASGSSYEKVEEERMDVSNEDDEKHSRFRDFKEVANVVDADSSQIVPMGSVNDINVSLSADISQINSIMDGDLEVFNGQAFIEDHSDSFHHLFNADYSIDPELMLACQQQPITTDDDDDDTTGYGYGS